MTSGLARRGVGEGDFAAENLAVQRREGVRRLGVHQAEKLQLVDVKVANGLHDWKLGDHLGGETKHNKLGPHIEEHTLQSV